MQGLRAMPVMTSILVVLALSLMGGCGSGNSDREPMPMEQTMYGEQIKQMNKVREQVQEMEGRKDDLDKRLEEAGE